MRGLIPLLCFVGLIGLLSIAILRGNSDKLSYNLLEKPFPAFQLTELYDEEQTLSEADIAGQITLVNVFGTWCAPCKIEHPKFMELAKEKSFKLVGLNWRDPRPRTIEWLKQLGNPYDTVIFDRMGELVIALGVTGAPETYVIDKKGLIRFKHVGIVTDEVWDKTLFPLIQKLEAEP